MERGEGNEGWRDACLEIEEEEGRKLGAKNEDGDGEEILHCNPVCCSTLVSRVLAARGKMMTFLALLDRNLVYSSEGNAGFLEYVFLQLKPTIYLYIPVFIQSFLALAHCHLCTF